MTLVTDPDNVWLTVSARELRPDLTIVARAREERARSKLLRAGATRVVNPQVLGGQRLAESAVQRHVADFLEAVLHEESSDHRMAGFEIDAGSPLVGRTLAEAALGERTGALVIAVRDRAEGWFVINPSPGIRLAAGSVVIVVGTASQLAALRKHSMPT